MNSELKIPSYTMYCNRDIIFKKYNKEISELVRLDFNIDLLPEKKGNVYIKNGIKNTDILYIDMSSTQFKVFNEDLKRCGHYNYNDEKIIYYQLPLTNKVKLRKENVSENKELQLALLEDEHLKFAISESLKLSNIAVSSKQIIRQIKEEQTTKVSVSRIQICGKMYLKSSVNILYDPETKEEVGLWDPETKTIKDLPDEYYETDDDEDVSTSRSRDTLNNNRRFGSGNNDEYISEEEERHIQEVLAVSLHDVGGGGSDSVAVCEVVDEVLKFAITESLKYDAPKLSGIKAQERLESQKHKNKPKAKNTTIAGFEFQNEKIRKQWN